MNRFRFLAYLLIACAAYFVAILVEIIARTGGPEADAAEVRTAIVVLLLVIVALILIVLFLLCLGRAKMRWDEERELYRRAHGDDESERREAQARLERLEGAKRSYGRCSRVCDMLVRKKFPRDCIRLPIEVTRHPDPCIYSQFFLMENGLSVTWDNPNVEILLGGVPQDTYNLAAGTTYDVRVGIENASPLYDALATNVRVNMLSFGIGGTTATPLHNYVVDVPAATPYPGVPETFSWTTPAKGGHFCLQVLIEHADDINPQNNEGWNNTNVREVAPGDTFRLTIPLANPLPVERRGELSKAQLERYSRIEVVLDSYELRPGVIEDGDPESIFEPRATIWGARVTPTQLKVAPGANGQPIEFEVKVPDGAAAGTTAVFNISAKAGPRAIGGVTVRLKIV